MNGTNISIFLYAIFISSQVTNSFSDDKCNNDQVSKNVTSSYRYSSLSRRYRRQNTNTNLSCEIPNYPPNSIYKIVSEPEAIYKPGDYVKQFSILGITCHEGYQLPPKTVNLSNCLNGQWYNLPSACLRACPSLISTTSTTVKCTYNRSISLDNCIHPVDGTTVRLSCNTFYEADTIRRNPTRSCRGGKWTPNLPECYATCGLKSPKQQLNIINGTNATPGDYPWQVAVYRNSEEFICGGSIIAQNIILSAAHCFTNYSGNVYPPENYLIAAAKYYRKYDDDRDIFAQYSTVLHIFVPGRFKSIGGLYSYDIAVVILKDNFKLTENLQPVCIELSEEYESTNYLINNGTVTGWGLTTQSGNLSDELQELTIPYIPYQKCYDEVPTNYRSYLMFDKICGGYLNQGMSFCQGDSGGALVYNINDKHYVKGIVSTSPTSMESGATQCNSQQYGLYTSVYHHIDFVREHITDYGWKESLECPRDDCTIREVNNRESCRLPNFPQNGEYNFPDENMKYEPLNYIPKYSAILLSCDIGYEPNPSDGQLNCIDEGLWVPAVGICTELGGVTASSITTSAATTIDCKHTETQVNGQSSCQGRLIFEDNFENNVNLKWQREVTFSNAPDSNFVFYDNLDNNLQLLNNKLHIKPSLTEDTYEAGKFVDLGDSCTRETDDCIRINRDFVVPPIISAKITTKRNFSFRYGTIEIRAKFPQGDWIYPELLLMSKNDDYGTGIDYSFIRIALTRGNSEFSKTLSGGCVVGQSPEARTGQLRHMQAEKSWTDDFHIYELVWAPDKITLLVDNITYGNIVPPPNGFVGYESIYRINPKVAERWKQGSPLAPFDQEMFIVIGLGVGGKVFEYNFPFWTMLPTSGERTFMQFQNLWRSTWNNNSELIVDYVKVWSL